MLYSNLSPPDAMEEFISASASNSQNYFFFRRENSRTVKRQKLWDTFSYRVGPPFARQSAATRRGIDSTSRWKSPEEIFIHAASTAVHNYESVAGAGF
ncbi:hypothetical protein AVEN_186369-1 [Araneus ventricosus]|uniref:Uncharacterized protein n=1 Tax=Araneus ventricosus TaxID=182803 RepID=A0A4Y2RWA5_ARAVE|nr:hypothetical protein AVEN_186369-1 [Araneus ventricosus]